MDSILSRIIEIERKDRVRTPEGARRYGQPIGSVIRRDRLGNILPRLQDIADTRTAAERAKKPAGKKPTAKKPSDSGKKIPGTPQDTPVKGLNNIYPEPDEDGYEVVTDGKRKKYYIAQDEDGSWGAWDARDNFIAVGDSHSDLLKNLDTATASKTPAGMHLASVKERQKLVVPPDWREVYISDDSDHYLLAKGFDAKGRAQSLYHPDYRQKQDAAKFARMKKMFKEVEKLDAALQKDAMNDDTAAATLMMRALGMRPGSTKDTGADVPTYGATTLLAKHVTVRGDTTTLKFIPGKKKEEVTIKLKDPFVARVLSKRLETRKRNTPIFDTNERKTSDYFKKAMGNSTLKQKDLRTLKANELAMQFIKKKRGAPKTKTEFRRWRKEVEDQVSSVLGNTPSICRSSYINPAVYQKWLSDESWW